MNSQSQKNTTQWPKRLTSFPDLMTPVEAAPLLLLDEVGHTPSSSQRTLDYWRQMGELRATQYGCRVWDLKSELEAFLKRKTEQ